MHAETPSTDRPALLAFFDAADGENWKNKDNWGIDGAPVSSWYGVSINSYGRVVKIDLPDNNLKGIDRVVVISLPQNESVTLNIVQYFSSLA